MYIQGVFVYNNVVDDLIELIYYYYNDKYLDRLYILWRYNNGTKIYKII